MLNNLYDKTKECLSLSLIIIFGAILRFSIITKNSLWVDEIATIYYSTGDLYDIVFGYMMNGEFNPPLFYTFEYIITSLFGISELTLRFLPAIFGILTIPVIYYISKKIICNNYLSYLNAFLVSILPLCIYYSVEARCYSLALLLFSIGFCYYLYGRYTSAAIFFLLLTWTHFYGVLFILPILLHYIACNGIKNTYKNILLYIIGISPLALPLYHLLTLKGDSDVGWGLNYLDILPQFFTEIGGMNIMSGLILFCLFFAGFLYYKNIGMKFIILLPLIIAPFTTLFINISTRYLIYLVPFYIIMLTYPMMQINIKSKINIKTLYTIFVIFMLLPGVFSVCQETKIDYRGAAEFVYENAPHNSQIIIMPSSREDCFTYYYKGENAILSLEPYDLGGLQERVKSDDIIIKTGVKEYETGNDIISIYLNENCDKIKEFNLISVYKFVV